MLPCAFSSQREYHISLFANIWYNRTEQPCCRVVGLYSYIEWGWCWWTRNRLILKISWLLVCSFLHCWHSFLRLSDNVLSIEKPPETLTGITGEFSTSLQVNHFVGGCSFFIFIISWFFQIYKYRVPISVSLCIIPDEPSARRWAKQRRPPQLARNAVLRMAQAVTSLLLKVFLISGQYA